MTERQAPTVLVHPSPEALAAEAAVRLLTVLIDAQREHQVASAVLTGGGVGIAVLEQLGACAAGSALDWGRVELWWGDERWVQADSPERNDVQAQAALLQHVPLQPARVHRIGHPGNSDSPEAAATAYASALAAAAPAGAQVPAFDVLLLGVGGEGHVASIFPGSPAARSHEVAVGVRDCPKPPPLRVSLGWSALRSAQQVWLLAAGGAKAQALARAASGAEPADLPAAGAIGRRRTLWLLDEAAAAGLPAELRR